jgi:hypothetical protein
MVPGLLQETDGSSSNQYESFKRTYFDRPDAFASECINWPDGMAPTPYQLDILSHLPHVKRASARGPHGLGKSAMAAIATHWYALTRDGFDWKVVTTASVWAQLIQYLWPEIHKWSRLLKWDQIGRKPYNTNKELFTMKLVLKTGQAMAVASDDPQRIEGAHADYIMYIFDESKIVPDPTWDSAEGAMSSGHEKLWMAISTPGEPVGRFYQIQSKEPGYEDWWVRHVTLREAVDAGRIDPEWAEQRKLQWGAKSVHYLNRVEGQFASGAEETVIPGHWVDAAIERGRAWLDWRRLNEPQGLPSLAHDSAPITHVGFDIARFGGDVTIFAPRSGNIVMDCIEVGAQDTMETAGDVVAFLRNNQSSIGVIDIIGLGAGVYDRVQEVLRDQAWGHEDMLFPFIASHRTDWTDTSEQLLFRDSRSAAWWNMRQLLDPAYDSKIILPDDRELRAELVSPGFTSLSDGRIKVEPKEDIRTRLGRSTNRADAVIMSFWEEAYNTGIEFG